MVNHLSGFLYAASKDIAVINVLASDGVEKHCEAIAFHSQQAAEKMLKSVFTQNGIVPNKTHSVDELLSQAVKNGWLKATEESIDAATNISMHAVAARYAQMPDINKGEALQAIINCNCIAHLLETNGYTALSIDTPAKLLSAEYRQQRLKPEPARQSLSEIQSKMHEASEQLGSRGQNNHDRTLPNKNYR